MINRFNVDQLVRVSCHYSLAYGRIARVIRTAQHRVDVRFVDLPGVLSDSQRSDCHLTAFTCNDLTPVQDVLVSDFYLLVTVVERDGDRHPVHQCLAHGQHHQSHTEIADGVVRDWYGIGGKWDADEQVYRFSLRRFVFAESWHEIPLADYVNLRSVLSDRTATNSAASRSQA